MLKSYRNIFQEDSHQTSIYEHFGQRTFSPEQLLPEVEHVLIIFLMNITDWQLSWM